MKAKKQYFNNSYFVKKLFYKYLLTLLIVASGCNNIGNQKTVKLFNESSEKEMIISEEMINDVPLDIYFSFGYFYFIDSLMVIFEASPKNDNIFHILNRKNFNYILSAGSKGRGPGEITPQSSNMFINQFTKTIFVNDFGKFLTYKFPIESLLINKDFLPEKKLEMNKEFFLNQGYFINDSIVIGTGMTPINESALEQRIVSYNINTSSIDFFGYNPQNIKHRDTYGQFDLCLKNGIYVKSYPKKGLLEICDIQGTHLLTIKDSKINNNYYQSFSDVKIYNNYIITSMIGDFSSETKTKDWVDISPRTFIVFDLEGNHIKTIKTKGGFSNWITDDDNERLIIYFNDRKHLFGYIDLAEILP